MSGSRPSFREIAARRLAEDGGALSPAVENFLSDRQRPTIRAIPVSHVDVHVSRRGAEPDRLEPLVESVQRLGVLEPILVRPLGSGGFEVVAGERRLHAARLAGIESIMAVVQDMDDETAARLVAARRLTDQPMPAAAHAPIQPAAQPGPLVPSEPAPVPASGPAASPAPLAPLPVAPRPVSTPIEPPPLAAVTAAAPTPPPSATPLPAAPPSPAVLPAPFAPAAVPLSQAAGVGRTDSGHSAGHRLRTNGTYMPPAVVTRREPRVISGPGIPGPGSRPRPVDLPAAREPEERAVADGNGRPSRFRFGSFPFRRRDRDGSGGSR